MNIQKTFKNLSGMVQAEWSHAKKSGTAHMQAGRFDEAEQALQRAWQLDHLDAQLHSTLSLWLEVMPVSAPPRAPSPTPPHLPSLEPETVSPDLIPAQRTPESDYFLAVLQALAETDGRGPTALVIARVGELMQGVLNDFDRQMLESGSEFRWRNTAHWARLKLVRRGLMSKDAARGTWEITDEGRAYLEENMADRG